MIPLRQKWQEVKGTLGFGRNVLDLQLEREMRRLEQYHLFNWPEIRNLIERAKHGTFVDRNAMGRLINAAVIDDFLFGSGFSGDRALQFLKPFRQIRFVRATACNNNDQMSMEK